MNNPYNWSTYRSSRSVERPELVQRISRVAITGRGVLVLGGLGMGKTALLAQVATALGASGSLCIQTMAGSGRPGSDFPSRLVRSLLPTDLEDDPVAILTQARRESPEIGHVTLLIDGFDRIGSPERAHILLAKLEALREQLSPFVGVVVSAGGGFFTLRDDLGSPFLSRAELVEMQSLSSAEIATLAQPLSCRGLSADALDVVGTMSGGHPLLVTFVLERLWSSAQIDKDSVRQAFIDFAEEHRAFVDSFVRRTLLEGERPALTHMLEYVGKNGPEIDREALFAECEAIAEDGLVPFFDYLGLLISAGIVAFSGRRTAQRLMMHLRPSILTDAILRAIQNHGTEPSTWADLILDACLRIHAMSPDFFRHEAKKPLILPESVFSAMIAISAGVRGWEASRESISGAGRSDVRARMPGSTTFGIAEVKIWPRNDYEGIHSQVCSYLAHDCSGAVAVMICESAVSATKYSETCLKGLSIQSVDHPHPFLDRFVVNHNGRSIVHLLLRLASR